ncbi:MAG TPA: hypothetical protein VKK79_09585 [Candidatus Lokiarchaeia archaeon]|nr:hypothetical protein [Candidatus Lokiarchaeia archaeon]
MTAIAHNKGKFAASMQYLNDLWEKYGRPEISTYKTKRQQEKESTEARKRAFNAKYASPTFPGCAWQIQVRAYYLGDLPWGEVTRRLLKEGKLIRRK